VRVRDHGIGLEPDMLTRVFDLFVQGGKSSGGLGIGLTLARTLVELHGGTVRASSEGPGRGTEFVVRLPVGLPAESSSASRSGAADAEARPLWSTLIVDDNVDGATTLAEALRRRGHEVRVVHDGASALREVERCVPDLVLLDLGLPDLDGFEVASRLRRLPALRDTKLVAVSGYGQEHHQRRSSEAGFDRHLIKPIDLAQLEAALESLDRRPAP
jgi:two-component system CheB/CheR fusion protein